MPGAKNTMLFQAHINTRHRVANNAPDEERAFCVCSIRIDGPERADFNSLSKWVRASHPGRWGAEGGPSSDYIDLYIFWFYMIYRRSTWALELQFKKYPVGWVSPSKLDKTINC